jgi:hypothetical protein
VTVLTLRCESAMPCRAATVLLSLAIGSFSRDRAYAERSEDELDDWIWTLSFGDDMF